MSLRIQMMTLGKVATNAYLLADEVTRNAVLIDPVDDAERIYRQATSGGYIIRMILATHAHFDHVLASKALKELTGAPFLIHKDCVEWLEKLPMQGHRFGLGEFPEAARPDRLLGSESEVIVQDSIRLKTLYTPGHAPGHLAFYSQEHKVVFSGDALFQGSIGRTDLPGGNHELLLASIFSQLMTLEDDVMVLSGHGAPTRIGDERRTNPFLQGYA
jgi:glyoxylase-like metal-dependent hydrolase (beta-lactamase superfamily II)